MNRPDAGVEVERGSPAAGAASPAPSRPGPGRAGVHLPEPVGGDLELVRAVRHRPPPRSTIGPAGRARAPPGWRDQAVGRHDDVVGAVLAQPRGRRRAAGRTASGCASAGRLVPGTGSTTTSRSMPASRRELLGDHGRLEPALLRQVDVLEVAAAAAAGAGVRARRRPPGAARVSTSTASPRRNRPPSSVISTVTRSPGSACRTKTTRPSCRATKWPPCATGPTSTLEPRSDERSSAGSPWCHVGHRPVRVRPRRTSPGRARSRSQSSRSLAISEPRSW